MSQIFSRTPGPDTVSSSEIIDGAIVNADVNASAAIVGSKLDLTSGTGAIDTTVANITTGGILKVDVDGTATNAAGSFTFGAGNDASLYWDGSGAILEHSTGLTNTVTYSVLKHITSGTPANSIGVGLEFEQETTASNNEKIAALEAVVTDVTATEEDAKLNVRLMIAGAAHATTATFDLSGLNLVTGDAFYIADTSVLSATTLGSGVLASSLTSVGTLTSGTWSATTIAVDKGGSGQTSYTDGQLLIGNSTGNTLAKATLTGTANQVTVANGAGSVTLSTPQDIAAASSPTFAGVTLNNTGLHLLDTNASHDLIIAPGSDLTADRTLTITTGDAASAISIEGSSSVINQDVTSDASPTFTTVNATTFDTNIAAAAVTLSGTTLAADGTDLNIDIAITPKGTGAAVISKATISAGTITGITDLTVADGGTGASTLTDGGIVLGSGTDAVTVTAQPSSGQLLIGSTGVDPVLSTLTGTANQVVVTNGAGSVTLSTPQSIASTSDVTFGSATLGKAAKALDVQNTTDAVSNQVVVLGSGNRATPADNDEGYISLNSDDDLGAQVEFARLTWRATDVTSTTKDSSLRRDVMVNNVLTNMEVLDGTGLSIGTGTDYQIAGTSVLNATTLGAAVVSSSLTSVGTLTSGTWSATTVAVDKGGTGQTSYTDGQLLIGNSTGNTLAKATLTGTANQVTVTNGSGTVTLSTPQDIAAASSPTFAGVTLNNTGLHLLDTNASHDLIIAPGSDLTADRTLTVTTGDAASAISIEGSSSVIDQDLTTDATPTFAAVRAANIGNAASHIQISSAGEVNMNLQPAFRATLSADITNVTGNNTKYVMIFNTEAYDQNADYATGTGVFTAPIGGRYRFTVNVFSYGHTASGSQYDIFLENTGATILQYLVRVNPANVRAGTNLVQTASTDLTLAATDTVRVAFQVNGEGSDVIDLQSGVNCTAFCGYLIA